MFTAEKFCFQSDGLHQVCIVMAEHITDREISVMKNASKLVFPNDFAMIYAFVSFLSSISISDRSMGPLKRL